MFLKANKRKKDGKVHRYWSIVESYRLANGRSAKRQVLYLGEINDSQKLAWCKSIAALEGQTKAPQQIALFPTDRQPPEQLTDAASEVQPVQVDLSRLELCRPRQWGGCWLALQVWNLLGLDEFFKPKLPPSRKGTPLYKILWARLKELRAMDQTRDELLMRLGAAKKDAGRAWHLVKVNVPERDQPVNEETISYTLRRGKLRIVMRREGRYLLRAFVPETMPAPEIWRQYIGLTEIEESFKNLKGDLAIRPIYHQREDRIEAHIFVSFLSYCLHVALRAKLKPLATGLTPRAVLEKFGTLQMIDVHLPAGEDTELVMPRYTQPDKDLSLLLTRMGLVLPQQPPPTLRELTAIQ